MEVLSAGFALAISTVASFVLTAWKLPNWAKSWLLRHKLLTDIGVFALAFFLLTAISKSAVSMVASIMTGLLVSAGLEGLVWWETRRVENGLPPMFGEGNEFHKNYEPKPAPRPAPPAAPTPPVYSYAPGPPPEEPLTLKRILRAVALRVLA